MHEWTRALIRLFVEKFVDGLRNQRHPKLHTILGGFVFAAIFKNSKLGCGYQTHLNDTII